jgi:hypothetical protein
MRGSATEEGRSADVLEENNTQNHVIAIKIAVVFFLYNIKEENVFFTFALCMLSHSLY